MAQETVSRAQVLAYRFTSQGFARPAADLSDVVALTTGIRDSPPGRSAHVALRARMVDPLAVEDLADLVDEGRRVALAYTVRGAMHLHTATDLARYAVALKVESGEDLSVASFGPFAPELGSDFPRAVDQVAGAMKDVMSDGVDRTKGELSGAITPMVDKRLAPWCAGCGVHHVQDALYRYATLPAGLRLAYEPLRLMRARPGRKPSAAAARRELVRRYLRAAGPASPGSLGAWLGLAPPAARRLWDETVGDDVVQADVEGRRTWVHRDDVTDLTSSGPGTGVRLLPPYDPITELADRELLVPVAGQRKQVWRAATNPGVLLIDGDIAGTWRQRRTKQAMTVTVTPFGQLTPDHRRAAQADAEELGRLGGADRVDVAWA